MDVNVNVQSNRLLVCTIRISSNDLVIIEHFSIGNDIIIMLHVYICLQAQKFERNIYDISSAERISTAVVNIEIKDAATNRVIEIGKLKNKAVNLFLPVTGMFSVLKLRTVLPTCMY